MGIKIVEGEFDEKPAKGTYRCEICGYQLFDDDTECPNCGTKIK